MRIRRFGALEAQLCVRLQLRGCVGLKAPLTVRSHMMNRRIIAPKASKTGFNPLHKTRSILAVNKRGVP